MTLLFLGFGRIARKHFKALRATGRAPDLAVATADPERGRRIAREHGFAFAAPSYEEGIADSRVHAVFISLPPNRHFPMAKAALEQGKHVVLEKPATRTAAEFEELLALAERAGRRVFVTENHSFMPFHLRLRKLLREGAIGDVREVHMTRAGRVGQDGSWRFDRAQGPGALLEGGVHWVRRMCELACPDPAGEAALPWRVMASCRTDGGGPVELASFSVVRFGHGVTGTVAHSWIEPRTSLFAPHCRIVGSRGVIKFRGDGMLGLVQADRRSLLLPTLADREGFGGMWRAILDDLGGGVAFPLANGQILSDLRMIEECYRLQAEATD